MGKTWGLVFIASFLEILWATGLKYSNHWLSWLGTIFAIYLSFVVLMKATEKLPVATAYAVYTGSGTGGTVLIDILLLGGSFSWPKLFFILLLLTGVFGLKLVTKESNEKVVEG